MRVLAAMWKTPVQEAAEARSPKSAQAEVWAARARLVEVRWEQERAGL
jgi:hypothetical protein